MGMFSLGLLVAEGFPCCCCCWDDDENEEDEEDEDDDEKTFDEYALLLL